MIQNNTTFGSKRNAGENDGDTQPFYATYVPNKSGTFKVNIHQPIVHPDQFMYVVQALEAADEDNGVDISLQSPGGSTDAADYLIHHMRKCQGHIHVTASGNCSSAASFILLQADSFELSEGFSSTLHCGSLGSGGNFNEYKQQTAFYNKYMEKTLRDYYQGFVTEPEMDAMLDGKDIILDAQGWITRYEARNEYFKAKIEAAQKPPKKPRKPKLKVVPKE